jgi:hypothetical protein
MVLEEIVCRMWIDSSGSELGPVADCYEHDNETSGSIKYDVFQYFCDRLFAEFGSQLISIVVPLSESQASYNKSFAR